MTSSTALRPSVRAAFGALIDYAGLFPPARLAPAEARDQYRIARDGPHAWMLGRFIIPAAALDEAAEPFDAAFSAIVEPNVDALDRLARLRAGGARVEALEIPLTERLAPFRDHLSPDEMLNVMGALETDLSVSGLRDLPTFVEIPRAHPWWNALTETMATLSRFNLGAKLRCGGPTADAFPSIGEVAEFVAAAAAAGVRFKATAGLHHPVRHEDASTGFLMHGFLNVLAAAAFAPQADAATLRAIVAEEEVGAFVFAPDSFAWRGLRAGIAQLEAARRDGFVAYGSCSFAEPIADLTAMGLLTSA